MIELKAINPENAEFYRQCRNDPAVRCWCRQVGLISKRDQEKWLAAQNDDPKIRMFEISESEGDKPVGVTGLTSIDLINRRAEFSLWIAPQFQQQGFGKIALEKLLAFGFNELGLNLVWGESFDKNPAIKTFEKLGFKFEGTRRAFYYKEGKFTDAHLYSILRDEWKTSV